MTFRPYAACALTLLLAACASSGSSGGGGDLAHVQLFAADGTPHFSFYYSCAGSVSQESELCSVPSGDFSEWASDHHVLLKRVTKDDFDEKAGVAAGKLSPKDSGLAYRVFVRFAPIAIGSVQWSMNSDVKGGYTPPKAGYRAEVFVYNVANGTLAAHAEFGNRTEAKDRADPTPFVRDGVIAVLKALGPGSQETGGY